MKSFNGFKKGNNYYFTELNDVHMYVNKAYGINKVHSFITIKKVNNVHMWF